MNHSFKIILTLLVFLSSFSLASEPVNQSKVVLDKVEIVGTKINNDDLKDIFAWYGIPYAQPPVDELRWKAPRDF